MKRYLFLILAAIFCLPSIGFAQNGPMLTNVPRDLQSVDPARAAWNSMINSSNKSLWETPKKNRKSKTTTSPRAKYINAIECSTDEATGQTTMRWADGSSYVGETYRTTLHGTGTMIYPDSSRYYGGWKYSYRDGVGTMEYTDGSKYIGQWVRDIPNGDGTLITPEGTAFSGKFKDGEPHGKCLIQAPDGTLYKGRWHYGKLRKRSVKSLKEKK